MDSAETQQLNHLAGRLSAFDTKFLASAIGALQLIPINAPNVMRLERAAAVVASLSLSTSGQTCSRQVLDQLVNSTPVTTSSVIRYEDPFEESWTQSIMGPAGEYLALPGNANRSVTITEQLLGSLFYGNDRLTGTYADEMLQLTRLVLWLSNACCTKSGRTRNEFPFPHKRDRAHIPSTKELNDLRAAVTFSWAQLEGWFGDKARTVLSPLVREPGQLAYPIFPDESPCNPQINIRPIVDFGDEMVVLAPSSLLVALKHRCISRAVEDGIEDEVAKRYREFLIHNTDRSLGKMGWVHVPLALTTPERFVERIYRIDVDKVAHVLIAADDLTNWDATDPFASMGDKGALQRGLDDRIPSARNEIHSALPNHSVLHLIVVAGVGRTFDIGFGGSAVDDDSYILAFDPPDLETVARLENEDPLALWYYAVAKERLADDDVRVLSFSPIDEYSMYHSHDHSFYMSDDGKPSFISVEPGTGLDVRNKTDREWDVHAAIGADRRSVIPFLRRYPEIDAPIYIGDPASGVLVFAVEGLPFTLRVRRGEYPDSPGAAEWSFQFMETVAYWIWQLTPWLSTLGYDDSLFMIDVELTEGSWTLGLASELDDDEDWLSIRRSNEGLVMTFTPAAFSAMNEPDNEAERGMVASIARAFDLDADVWAVVDAIAPRGPKKKLVFVSDEHRPDIRTDDLPEPRYVQSAVVHLLLDETGAMLFADGAAEGPIPDDIRKAVLNKCVAHNFTRLEQLVATLDCDSALAFFIEQNETVVANEAQESFMAPTRIACFEDDTGYVEGLIKSHKDRIMTSITTRFVIEYLGAQPPTGSDQMTQSIYDELIGLASEIVNKGQLSDIIHFKLADTKLAYLGSGRLGIQRFDTFESAITQFLPGQVQRALRHSSDAFESYWINEEPTEVDTDFLAEVNLATTAEFGFSLQQFAQFGNAVENIYGGSFTEPHRAVRSELVEKVCVELQWEPSFVENMLGKLTIEPRKKFITKENGTDVYPWRFNRALSYPRRPFVRRMVGDVDELFWGSRNLRTSGRYLSGLIEGGRLKAESEEMRALLGAIRSEEPEKFTDVVADAVDDSKRVVQRRVKKFGRLRLLNENGNELGDIDVLVINNEQRRVTLVEAKDFEIARTPAEISNEIDKLFEGSDCTTEKHMKRTAWVQANLSAVLAHYGITATAKNLSRWKVEGVIVTNGELLSPMLMRQPRLPVLTIDTLKKHLETKKNRNKKRR